MTTGSKNFHLCPRFLGHGANWEGPRWGLYGEAASIGMSSLEWPVVLISSVRFWATSCSLCFYIFSEFMVLFYLSLVPFGVVQQVLQLTYQLVPYGSQMWLAGQKITSYSSMRFPFECQVGIQWHQLLDKQFAASTTGKPQQKKTCLFYQQQRW